MTAPADLEIGLFRWNADSYVVELRYTHPESDTDVRLQRAGPAVQGSPPGAPEAGAPGAGRTMAAFDLGRLRTIQEGAAYGEALSGGLFGDPPVRAMFAQARSIAQSVGAPLRVRLSIGAGAPELHELRWETLCDPQGLRPLATDERVYLSRYLSSLDWHPVRLRPRGDLSALVVIASPAGLGGSGPGQWALPALDVEGERLRAGGRAGGDRDVLPGLTRARHPERADRRPARAPGRALSGVPRRPGPGRAVPVPGGRGRRRGAGPGAGAGRPAAGAPGAPPAGGARLVPERRERSGGAQRRRRRAGRAGAPAGRGRRSGGAGDAGERQRGDGEPLHAGLLRRAAAGRPDRAGGGRGPRRGARATRLVGAGPVHAACAAGACGTSPASPTSRSPSRSGRSCCGASRSGAARPSWGPACWSP